MRKIEEIINTIENDTLEHYRDSITRNRYVRDIEKVRQVLSENEPSDTDFVLIKRLSEIYHPAQKCIVSGPEMLLIQKYLEFDRRSVLQLRNLRNSVVMLMSEIDNRDFDRMSAITHVIDMELLNRGVEI